MLEEKFSVKRKTGIGAHLEENPKSWILRGAFQTLLLKSLRSEEKKTGVNTF